MNNPKEEQAMIEGLETAAKTAEEKTSGFFKKAFQDMKESARAQHEVDKANFEAAKAESRANFEENRGRNTFAKAKADAKASWDEAHMSPAERAAKMQAQREEQIAEAQARIDAAKKN